MYGNKMRDGHDCKQERSQEQAWEWASAGHRLCVRFIEPLLSPNPYPTSWGPPFSKKMASKPQDWPTVEHIYAKTTTLRDPRRKGRTVAAMCRQGP